MAGRPRTKAEKWLESDNDLQIQCVLDELKKWTPERLPPFHPRDYGFALAALETLEQEGEAGLEIVKKIKAAWSSRKFYLQHDSPRKRIALSAEDLRLLNFMRKNMPAGERTNSVMVSRLIQEGAGYVKEYLKRQQEERQTKKALKRHHPDASTSTALRYSARSKKAIELQAQIEGQVETPADQQEIILSLASTNRRLRKLLADKGIVDHEDQEIPAAGNSSHPGSPDGSASTVSNTNETTEIKAQHAGQALIHPMSTAVESVAAESTTIEEARITDPTPPAAGAVPVAPVTEPSEQQGNYTGQESGNRETVNEGDKQKSPTADAMPAPADNDTAVDKLAEPEQRSRETSPSSDPKDVSMPIQGPLDANDKGVVGLSEAKITPNPNFETFGSQTLESLYMLYLNK